MDRSTIICLIAGLEGAFGIIFTYEKYSVIDHNVPSIGVKKIQMHCTAPKRLAHASHWIQSWLIRNQRGLTLFLKMMLPRFARRESYCPSSVNIEQSASPYHGMYGP
jgi:hypothetical protein